MKRISHISSFIIIICDRIQKAITLCKVVKSHINPASNVHWSGNDSHTYFVFIQIYVCVCIILTSVKIYLKVYSFTFADVFNLLLFCGKSDTL